MRFRYRICALSVCIVLVSCLSMKEEKHKHFWDGSKAFEKRQTIEAYKRDTVPMIEKFLVRISQAGAGEFIFDGDDQDRRCGENDNGYDYWSPNISGKPIEVAEVIKAGDKYLVPAGFSKKTQRKHENGDVRFFWMNKKDGGYVTAIVSPKSHTGIYYISGCRPSDGSATPSPSPTPTGKLPDATNSSYKTSDPNSTPTE
ncbi:hypothetical protein HMPREF0043_00483 [Actinobaculum sp. oral taxon 183 str. F0552]|nr:hypothetical protein HMPREF0043_00483 [Actinobaculum sp. oral taxon 183 str. F0552]